MKICVLTYGDNAKGELKLELVGPFATAEAASKFGRDWQRYKGGDPRWQTVHLADMTAGFDLRIREPVG